MWSGHRPLGGQKRSLRGLKRSEGTGVLLATQEPPETAVDDDHERWPLEPLLSGLKPRGLDRETTPRNPPERLETWWAWTAIAWSGAPRVGEGRQEVQPITIKNHERPARRLFREGGDD